MDYSKMSLVEIGQLPGVKDMEPLMKRARFSQALKLEAQGKKEEAEAKLEEAIAV